MSLYAPRKKREAKIELRMRNMSLSFHMIVLCVKLDAIQKEKFRIE